MKLFNTFLQVAMALNIAAILGNMFLLSSVESVGFILIKIVIGFGALGLLWMIYESENG